MERVDNELTVGELIALLQQRDPDLTVRIPCPHCCGIRALTSIPS